MTKNKKRTAQTEDNVTISSAFEKRKYSLIIEILLIIWALLVFGLFFKKFKLIEYVSFLQFFFNFLLNIKVDAFTKYNLQIIFIVFFAFLALLVGRTLTRLFSIELKNGQKAVTYWGLGLGSLALLVFFLGIVGLLLPTLLTFLCVLLFVVTLVHNQDIFPKIRPRLEDFLAALMKSEPVEKIIVFIILLFLLLGFWGALSPEIFYDSLVYHLSLPNLYLLKHRIIATPENMYSGIPGLTQMLYAFGLAATGVEGAKLIQYFLGLLTLLGIKSFTSHGYSRKTTLFAMLIFCSMPMVNHEFMKVTVELPWAFFSLLTALHLLNLFDNSDEKSLRTTLVIAGIFCGFTLSIKYPAWIMLPVMLVVVYLIFKAKGEEFASRSKRVLLFAAAAFIVLSPWVIKNTIFYHNPIYPFLNDYVAGTPHDDPNWRGLKYDAWGRDLTATFTTIKGVWGYIIHPWTLTMNGMSEAGFIGPLFLIFLPWLFYPRWRNQKYKYLLYLFIGQWILGSMATTKLRFFIPFLAILSIVLAAIICQASSKYLRRFAYLLIFLTAGANFYFSFFIWINPGTANIFTGKISREEFLSTSRTTYPSPYFLTAQFVNKNLPPEARLLIIGDARGLYYKRSYHASSVFNKQYFIKSLESSDDAKSLYEKLRADNFTHIVINMAEVYRLKNIKRFSSFGKMDERMKTIFDEFWQVYVREVNFDHQQTDRDYRFVILYELLPVEAANQPHHIPKNYFIEALKRQAASAN